ncbi:MAG: YceI family protein [Conexibacteraceae bacterium]|nr:YceI family protein [Conexibacteraceae bacterium]
MSFTAPSIPTTGHWHIDTVHSNAHFSLRHNSVATFRAAIQGVTGQLADGVLSGQVQAANLDVGLLEPFKGHVIGEAFLDAEHHPTIDFTSTEIHAHEDGLVHLRGALTIKGVTKQVAAEGVVRGPQEVDLANGSRGTRLGLDLTTTLDRRDYGMAVYAGADWQVTLEVALQLALDE